MNLLTNINITILKNYKQEDFNKISNNYIDLGNIFSYIIYNKSDKYIIQLNISETEEYNTINAHSAIIEALELINDNCSDKEIIGYRQPSIELLIEIYKPLVDTLVNEQLSHWSNFEREDLEQMCYLVMVVLYRKQYYINKSVLKTSFCNYVLMQLRKFKNMPVTVSMSDLIVNQDENERLTMEDIIPDKNYDDNIERQEELEFNTAIFGKMKEIIVDLIGIRRYDQLYREYTTGNTTSAGRKTMQQIKEHLRKLGVNRSNIENFCKE